MSDHFLRDRRRLLSHCGIGTNNQERGPSSVNYQRGLLPVKITKKYISLGLIIGLIVVVFIASGCNSNTKKSEAKEIRIGYFANITHAQALVGLAKGTFQEELGKDVKITTSKFNAGPQEIEALFSGAIDVGYIGPSPAVNGYIKSNGEALRIIAGAANGGASLVIRSDAKIKSIKDLAGKRVASPQLGNTQDVALRHFLQVNGLKAKEKGGTVEVIPTENANILTLFIKKELDAAWVPEPWASRLVEEGGGKILTDERTLWPGGNFSSANVIVSTKFLKENLELVEKFLKGHVKTTDWINQNLVEAKAITNGEIKKITGKQLKPKVLDKAFSRLTLTYNPVKDSVLISANWSFSLGFLKKEPKLDNLYDLELLNKVLKESGKSEI